jgi:hypothetical protein
MRLCDKEETAEAFELPPEMKGRFNLIKKERCKQ